MNKLILIFSTLILASSSLTSQEDSLNLDDIYVIKSFKPQIDESGKKIAKSPKSIESKVERMKVNYPFIEKQYEVDFHPSSIDAAKMKRQRLTKLYKNNLVGSIGNYLNTNFELYHSNLRNSKRSSGFSLKHLGSSSDLKETGYAGFSQNKLHGFYRKTYAGKKYYKLVGGVAYNKYHYYGYDPLFYPELNKANTSNTYFGPNANFSWGNIYTNKDGVKSGFEAGLGYQYWSDRLNSTEHNIKGEGSYVYALENTDFVQVDGLVDLNTFSRDSISQNSTIVGLRPVFHTKFDDLVINAGLGIYGDFGSSNNFSVKPIVDAQYNLIEGIFIPYFKVDGAVNRSNFYRFSHENNFINSNNLSLQNENESYKINTGLKLSISDEITAKFSFRNGLVKNHAFFINDTLGFNASDTTFFSGNQFITIYDRLSYTSLVAELNVLKTNKYRVNALVSNTKYTTENEDKAWHLPAIRVAIDGSYNFSNKIIFNAIASYNSKRYAKIHNPITQEYSTKELKGYVDLNLGAEYRYTKKLSAFLQVRNLIGTRYEVWNNFPGQSINVVFGIKATFKSPFLLF